MNNIRKILLACLTAVTLVFGGMVLTSCVDSIISGNEISEDSASDGSRSESTGSESMTGGSDLTDSTTSDDSTGSGNTDIGELPHTHEYGDWTVTIPATCTEEGEKQRTCIEGDDTQTEAIPALGHGWGEWTVTTPAGCETAGAETRVCAHDNSHIETREIPALGHDWNTDDIGWEWNSYQSATATFTCKHDDIHKIEIAATVTGEVTKEATTEQAGEKTYTAEVFLKGTTYADTVIEEIPRLEKFIYTVNDDGASYSITGMGTTSDSEIVIPSTYNGLPVTAIGSRAFYNNTAITSVTIPESINSIGVLAFYNCLFLTEINFNAAACNDLSSNNSVFYKAGQSGEGIKVKIGANVTEIPAYLFYPYSASAYAPKIVSINFAGGSICKSIGAYAFAGCINFTDITIPGSVISIGNYAFWNCGSLANIVIPDGINSIGPGMFYGCSGLLNVTIGSGVTSIDTYAFRDCISLENIAIPGNVVSVGSYAFSGCSGLRNVTIGNGVTSIGAYAFRNCTSLASITISESVALIGNYVFYNCTSLMSVIFEEVNGWWVSTSSTSLIGMGISSDSLADPATAALYLMEVYRNYYWKRS